jgi:3-hydroxyisobutyrate dehydrogenase
MAKVAWIGLGVMGYPMAGHLRKKGGHDLTVYNRNSAKAEAWVKEYGGKTAPTPADAAKDQDFVFCCVGNDNDLRDVTLGPKGAFQSVRKGAVFIDNTTASANIASSTPPPRARADIDAPSPADGRRTARSPSWWAAILPPSSAPSR